MTTFMDLYRSIGGDEASLAAGFSRIQREIAGDMARIERWRAYQEEWANMNGTAVPPLTGLEIARICGIGLLR